MTLCSATRCLVTIRHPGCDYVPNGLLPHLRWRPLTKGRCRTPWGTPEVVSLPSHVPLTLAVWCLPRVGWLLTSTGCFLGLHKGGHKRGLPSALWTRRPGTASQWDWTWQPWAANVCCVETLGSWGPTDMSSFWLLLMMATHRPRMWRGQLSRRSQTTMSICNPLALICTGIIHNGCTPPAPCNFFVPHTVPCQYPGTTVPDEHATSYNHACLVHRGRPWLLPLIPPLPPWPNLAQPHPHCGPRWGQVVALTGGNFGEHGPAENAQSCGGGMELHEDG